MLRKSSTPSRSTDDPRTVLPAGEAKTCGTGRLVNGFLVFPRPPTAREAPLARHDAFLLEAIDRHAAGRPHRADHRGRRAIRRRVARAPRLPRMRPLHQPPRGEAPLLGRAHPRDEELVRHPRRRATAGERENAIVWGNTATTTPKLYVGPGGVAVVTYSPSSWSSHLSRGWATVRPGPRGGPHSRSVSGQLLSRNDLATAE